MSVESSAIATQTPHGELVQRTAAERTAGHTPRAAKVEVMMLESVEELMVESSEELMKVRKEAIGRAEAFLPLAARELQLGARDLQSHHRHQKPLQG